jgi:hypothetical protein
MTRPPSEYRPAHIRGQTDHQSVSLLLVLWVSIGGHVGTHEGKITVAALAAWRPWPRPEWPAALKCADRRRGPLRTRHCPAWNVLAPSHTLGVNASSNGRARFGCRGVAGVSWSSATLWSDLSQLLVKPGLMRCARVERLDRLPEQLPVHSSAFEYITDDICNLGSEVQRNGIGHLRVMRSSITQEHIRIRKGLQASDA